MDIISVKSVSVVIFLDMRGSVWKNHLCSLCVRPHCVSEPNRRTNSCQSGEPPVGVSGLQDRPHLDRTATQFHIHCSVLMVSRQTHNHNQHF